MEIKGCVKFLFSGAAFSLALLGGVYAAYAGSDRATKAGLMPHKALYDIKLSGKKSGATVSNLYGKMFYEWQPSCDAWVTTHRYDLTYEYVEAPSVRVTSDFSSYESFDGKGFNFTSQRKSADVVFEEIRGSVQAQGNKAGQAVYTIPEDLAFELPQGTLYPVAHTLSVLDKVKQGKKFYNATIFDGSDEEGPVAVNSFIGKAVDYHISEEYAAHIDKTLVAAQGWNVRLAFFPLQNLEAAADYEMSVIFHENGVISDMAIDYGDFSVTQKLIAIEPLPSLCEGNDKNEK